MQNFTSEVLERQAKDEVRVLLCFPPITPLTTDRMRVREYLLARWSDPDMVRLCLKEVTLGPIAFERLPILRFFPWPKSELLVNKQIHCAADVIEDAFDCMATLPTKLDPPQHQVSTGMHLFLALVCPTRVSGMCTARELNAVLCLFPHLICN